MRWKRLAGIGAALMTAACAPAVVAVVGPATYVPTRTPGVMFVIVHPLPSGMRQYPVVPQPADSTAVHPSAEYILICDGRRGDGMRCEIATEATLRKYSYGPQPTANGPNLTTGIGGLGELPDITIKEPAQVPASTPSLAPPTPAPSAPPTPSSVRGKQ
jgi:hypothetical protein